MFTAAYTSKPKPSAKGINVRISHVGAVRQHRTMMRIAHPRTQPSASNPGGMDSASARYTRAPNDRAEAALIERCGRRSSINLEPGLAKSDKLLALGAGGIEQQRF